MKKDCVDKLQEVVCCLLEDYIPSLKNWNLDEFNYVKDFSTFFLIVQKFEFYKKNISNEVLRDAFINNCFFVESFIEGTPAYDNYLKQDRNLGKLKLNQLLKKELFSTDFAKVYDVFKKESSFYKHYVVIEEVKEQRIASAAGEKVSFSDYNQYKTFARNSKKIEIHDDEFEIPVKYISENEDDGEILLFKREKDGFYMYLKSTVHYCENFFGNKLVKLFINGKERSFSEEDDFIYYLTKIRDCIVHYGVKTFKTDSNQLGYCFKLDNETVIIASEQWIKSLSIIMSDELVSNVKLFFLPKHDFVIENEEQYLEVVNNGMILDISLKKEVYKNAFIDYVLNLFKIYRNSPNIKKDIVDFLVEQISNKYSVEVSSHDFSNIEKVNKRIMKDFDLYDFSGCTKLSKNKKIITQDIILERLINISYQELLVDSDNNQLYSISNNEIFKLTSYLVADVISFLSTSSAFDKKIELCAFLCQFSIFYRLVFNGFYDFIKNVTLSDNINISYYNTKEGKVRLKLNELDMSFIEIKDLNNGKTNHFVNSLSDKIFALRVIRNSISHNGFKFQISKSTNYRDIYLNLNSATNSNLVVRLKAIDLIDLLKNSLFRDFSVGYDYKECKFNHIEDEIQAILK